MSIGIYNNINNQTMRPRNLNATYAMPDTQPNEEIFNDTDTEAAKSTGGILLAGLALRCALKKLTTNMFSNFFSKNPNVNPQQLTNIGLQMLQDKGLMQAPKQALCENGTAFIDNLKKLNLIIKDKGQEAYFTHTNKQIVVTKDTLLALPHEIGHAVEEHSTKIFKALQRFRGNYTILALLLYGLGRNKSTNKKGKETFIGKAQNMLYKYNLLVPLVAFSPELITEFKASKIGIDYLKKSNAPKNIIKAAKKHYAVAFCTYLALPVFAVLDNLIINKAYKN